MKAESKVITVPIDANFERVAVEDYKNTVSDLEMHLNDGYRIESSVPVSNGNECYIQYVLIRLPIYEWGGSLADKHKTVNTQE